MDVAITDIISISNMQHDYDEIKEGCIIMWNDLKVARRFAVLGVGACVICASVCFWKLIYCAFTSAFSSLVHLCANVLISP